MRKNYSQRYFRSLIFAGLAFWLVRVASPIARDILTSRGLGNEIAFSGVLAAIGLIELIVFLSAGLIVWFILKGPVILMLDYIDLRGQICFVLLGVIAGLIFLPACAFVPFFLLNEPEAPDYLGRCIEYFPPMSAAGAVGGLVFWHSGSDVGHRPSSKRKSFL